MACETYRIKTLFRIRLLHDISHGYLVHAPTRAEIRSSARHAEPLSLRRTARAACVPSPGDPTEEQLARHFHLDATDHELVGQMRGAHNRVGFAVQLGTARFLGAFLDDPTHAPFLVTATIARQLSEVPAPSLDAYRDGGQRWRHIAIIRER